MKKLGVLGGVGPLATAIFMEMVIEMTEADTDQEHIDMIVHSCPQIPDRTSYIVGKSDESPLPRMIEIGNELAGLGCDVIAMPCITAHYFWDELQANIKAPIICTIRKIADYLKSNNIDCVGLMATTGTVKSNFFQSTLEEYGIKCIVPTEDSQGQVMHVIYDEVKANKPIELDRFFAVSGELKAAGAQVVILGCTELSVVRLHHEIGAGYLDAMQFMAKCAVEECGQLREEYKDLITKG